MTNPVDAQIDAQHSTVLPPVPAMPHDAGALSPSEARALFAAGLSVPTAGWSTGYAQANIIAVPQALAFDMMLFAQRNPKPCPILDILDAGEVRGGVLGGEDLSSHADIRT
ncbi:MAG TPA: hypothetical protein VFN43_04960, partial [Humibacillus sp.]|nr:hypothetical protein [Humibacillus sp.]